MPFGTILIIDGARYEVMDRGVKGKRLDIAVESHSEAIGRGIIKRKVWRVNARSD